MVKLLPETFPDSLEKFSEFLHGVINKDINELNQSNQKLVDYVTQEFIYKPFLP